MLAAAGIGGEVKLSREDFLKQFGDLINRFGPKKK
jgi:hypothetical protein